MSGIVRIFYDVPYGRNLLKKKLRKLLRQRNRLALGPGRILRIRGRRRR